MTTFSFVSLLLKIKVWKKIINETQAEEIQAMPSRLCQVPPACLTFKLQLDLYIRDSCREGGAQGEV